MKKIILSLAIVGVVGAIAIGGTIAYFSDTETSTGNTFTAGTLNLAVNGQNEGIIPVVVGNIAPGWSRDITYTVKNTGTISGNLLLASGSSVNTEGTSSEFQTAGSGDLGENIDVNVVIEGEDKGTFTLNELTGVSDLLLTTLNAGIEKTIVLHLSVDTTVDNTIQGDSVVADFTLALNQTTGIDESTATLTMENKDSSYQVITTDDINGTLNYNVSGSSLTFSFNGKVRTPSIGYTLLYVGPSGNYPYSGQLVLGTGTAGSDRNIAISGTVTPADSITDGKVWLIPSTTYPAGWDNLNILFEGTSRLNYTKI